MTLPQTVLLKRSFRIFVPIGNQAAALFYARLFELEPSARTLFSGSMIEQGARLTSTLAALVAISHRIDLVLPYARELGANHAAEGVQERHYTAGADALMWTLEKTLGSAFDGEVREAWATFISLLTHGLAEGARMRTESQPPGPTFVAA